MLKKENTEIRNQPHIMSAEGTCDIEPSKLEVCEYLQTLGWEATKVDVFHDNMQGFWRWSADIKTPLNAKLSNLQAERLKLLDASEVISLKYEGCVYISKDKVWMNGEIIDTLDTTKKISSLWQEFTKGEGI